MEVRSPPLSPLATAKYRASLKLTADDMKRGTEAYAGELDPSQDENFLLISNTQEELNRAAKKAVKEVGPRVYQLQIDEKDEKKDKSFNVLVFGCHGSGGKEQRDVAKLILRLIHEGKIPKPDIIVITGDNIYPAGVDSPSDPKFKTQFDDIYFPEFSALGIPFFIDNGNHDHRRYFYRKKVEETKSSFSNFASHMPFFGKKIKENIKAFFIKVGKKIALNQAAHSYLPHFSDVRTKETENLSPAEMIEHKKKMYQESILNTALLSTYNQPYPFYSLIRNNVQIFILDTNTYLKDYYIYLKKLVRGEEIDYDKNQAAWLEREYQRAQAEGRTVLATFHHSLVNWNKRAYPPDWDATLYLSPKKIKKLDALMQIPRGGKIGNISEEFKESAEKILEAKEEDLANLPHWNEQTKTGNHNGLLGKAFYEHQKMYFRLILTAHDHCLNVSHFQVQNSEPSCQVCSGAGGHPDLQGRRFFEKNEKIEDIENPKKIVKKIEEIESSNNLSAYSKQLGIALVSCDDSEKPNDFIIDLFNQENQHLKMHDRKHEEKNHFIQEAVDEKVTLLRQCVLAACMEYENFLALKHVKKRHFLQLNMTHKPIDVVCLDNIKNEMHRYEKSEMPEVLAYLQETLKNLTIHKKANQPRNLVKIRNHHFNNIIDKYLTKAGFENLDSLCKTHAENITEVIKTRSCTKIMEDFVEITDDEETLPDHEICNSPTSFF